MSCCGRSKCWPRGRKPPSILHPFLYEFWGEQHFPSYDMIGNWDLAVRAGEFCVCKFIVSTYIRQVGTIYTQIITKPHQATSPSTHNGMMDECPTYRQKWASLIPACTCPTSTWLHSFQRWTFPRAGCRTTRHQWRRWRGSCLSCRVFIWSVELGKFNYWDKQGKNNMLSWYGRSVSAGKRNFPSRPKHRAKYWSSDRQKVGGTSSGEENMLPCLSLYYNTNHISGGSM